VLHRLLSEERGQVATEFMGMLWLLLLAAVAVWQIMLIAWSADQAATAARVATRVQARSGNADKAAHWAVSSGLRDGMKVDISGDKATVSVRIPIFFPGLGDDKLRIGRSATLPS
jgi:pilus assembly protein CpaE